VYVYAHYAQSHDIWHSMNNISGCITIVANEDRVYIKPGLLHTLLIR